MKPKKIFYGGLAILFLAAGLLGLFWQGNDEVTSENVLEANLAEHKNLAMHIHPSLKITINGDNYPIPPNIGISPQGMRVIHTHEPTGKLHIEAPIPHQFSLGDFFTIWEKRLTNDCVFEFCEDEKNSLDFYVNGVASDFGPLIPLKDLEAIEIVYGEKP